jgi:hypothetical protein
LTTFIIQRFSQNQAYQIKAKCIYLAQAGLAQAVYFFRLHDRTANGYFTLGQTPIDTRNFFVLGATSANLLMVNTSASTLTNGNARVGGWTMQNATNSNTITIATMTVSWSGVSGRTLSSIYLNNTSVWSGSGTSGSTFNITDFRLNTTPTIYSNNTLRFSGSMAGATVNVTFNMTDGSSRALTIYPASQKYSFTIKSTGKTTNSNIYRTIEADYNALTVRITRYDEINTQVTP